MADQKSDNGGKGAPVPPGGKGPAVYEKWLKEQIQNLKGRVKEEGESLKRPEKTQLFKSMFRVKHDDSDRSRALGVLSNVFFHLHPAKINRDAVRYRFTWGMGGITFYLFLVLSKRYVAHLINNVLFGLAIGWVVVVHQEVVVDG